MMVVFKLIVSTHLTTLFELFNDGPEIDLPPSSDNPIYDEYSDDEPDLGEPDNDVYGDDRGKWLKIFAQTILTHRTLDEAEWVHNNSFRHTLVPLVGTLASLLVMHSLFTRMCFQNLRLYECFSLLKNTPRTLQSCPTWQKYRCYGL